MPTPLLITLGVVVWIFAVGLALRDLSRHEVEHLPRWAWALIIAFGQFPIGLIVYFVVGRRSPDDALPPLTERRPTVDAPQRGPVDLRARPIVTTTDVTKRFGEVTALDGVHLRVPRGVTYGLIGPNGAGKTTMLSILAGLRSPDRGAVALDIPREAVAVLPDTPEFEPWLTAREVVALALRLGRDTEDAAAVEHSLARTGLDAAADRRVKGFSRGMLQRLGLATCLVTDPELLIMDEPSSALDPAGRREVLDLITQVTTERTVILSTHILADVQRVADVVGVLDEGVLRFQGPLEELLTRTGSALDLTVREPSDMLLSALERAEWIGQVVRVTPQTLRLHVTDTDRAERLLAPLLAATDARVVALNAATDLESAFLSLTEGRA